MLIIYFFVVVFKEFNVRLYVLNRVYAHSVLNSAPYGCFSVVREINSCVTINKSNGKNITIFFADNS